ncbi:MAG: hypothetical protein SOU07_05450 [Bacilli bacterium]|nr:hypothetical protein [Acholeplasmataceae bacterium]MDY2902864.1 hypothetical protein [Bacilli bacterium]
MNENKISLYNNYRCIIENYKVIKTIENNIIIIDNYSINGEKLKIKRMNDYLIEIIGKIIKIDLGDNNEI